MTENMATTYIYNKSAICTEKILANLKNKIIARRQIKILNKITIEKLIDKIRVKGKTRIINNNGF